MRSSHEPVKLRKIVSDPATAPIFDIQRFSIHDGPGIRTLVFFKGCNLSCDWCQNPESQQPVPIISFYENRCRHSLHCHAVCEDDAIRSDGFRIDHDKCTLCLKCIDACAYEALKLIGRKMTPEQLMDVLDKDSAYYQSSGGGVTFSGGEPTMYPAFMEQTLALCHKAAIHTTLETCGSFSYSRWQAPLRVLDLIYFDLKVMNPEKHLAVTGFDNKRILDNARRLAVEGYPVEFRLPLVQGYTDDEENLRGIVIFLKSMKLSKLHLLSYHSMGEAKIDIIDGIQKRLGLPAYPQTRFNEIRSWFGGEGIEVILS